MNQGAVRLCMNELYEHSKCKEHIQEDVYILILVFKNSKGH